MNPNIRTGTYTGDGSAHNVVLGFEPDYVRIINITDGNASFEWFSGMDAGHAYRNVNDGTTQNSVITSNGISPYEGQRGGPDGAGFTAGTAVATNAKVFRYIAVRNGAGAG